MHKLLAAVTVLAVSMAQATGLALLIASPASAGTVYLTSLDVNSTFAAYDTVSNSWTTLSSFDTGAQMAASYAGDLYAWNRATGTIQVYDAVNDTWSDVIAAPPGASGSFGNLEITNTGEFLYTETDSSTLYYTSGGAWQTTPMSFLANAMGGFHERLRR